MKRVNLTQISGVVYVLLVMSAFVIVVAGMKAAAPILNPFLLSCFISILCAPIVDKLVSLRMPVIVAICLVLVFILLLSVLFGSLISNSIEDFTEQLPTYRESLLAESTELLGWLDDFGLPASKDALAQMLDPGVAMQLAANTLSGLGGVLANTFLIFLTVVFMLLESHMFPRKIRHALVDGEFSLARFNHFVKTVNHYLALKTIISVITGVMIGIFVWICDVDYPVLWGVLAFLLNYVPNIGSILAGVPSVLLGYVQHGSLTAVTLIGGYAAVNIVMGNLIEPRYMGKGLGLSTLIVFLSLIFWGWVLGPVGMLLSIPLTMIVKIALESNKDTAWISVILGSGTELEKDTIPKVPAKSATGAKP